MTVTKANRIHPDLRQFAVPIDTIRQLEGNPNRGNDEAVLRSLEEFGQDQPLIVRKSDRVIIKGNTRHRAATAAGWEEIAVLLVSDDKARSLARALADNRTADLGTEDDVALAAMLREILDADGALLAAASYDEADLAGLLEQIDPPAPGEFPALDPDDLPVDYQCPSCGYEWSGNPAPRSAHPEAEDEPEPGAEEPAAAEPAV